MSKSLLKEELFSYCNSDSISEDGLRYIIIERHGLTLSIKMSSFHLGLYEFFHAACSNQRVNEGIIQCLIEHFPVAASSTRDDGGLPLHVALQNPNMTLNIIQLLVDAAPASVRCQDNYGCMPLHHLCMKNKVDDAAALEILKVLIERHPEAVRRAENGGELPIHLAAKTLTAEFCRVLRASGDLLSFAVC